MYQRLLLLLVLVTLSTATWAQQFVIPAETFSHKKTTYVTLNDGTQLTGTIRNLDRKKGLIEEIKLDIDGGGREKIDPEDIAFAYLPLSGLDKVGRAMDFMTDATQWDSRDIDQEIMGQGYAYFEKTEVRVKNKTRTLLLQLMNPHFSSRVKVFHDPLARETMGIGVAGIQLAGGLDKSYYIKLGDAIAYRVKKKDYDEEFQLVFAGCDTVLSSESAMDWEFFADHTYQYAQDCGE